MERLVYTARLNAGDMLRDRGYNLPKEVTEIPFSEFSERLGRRNQIDLYAEKLNDPSERIFMKFYQSHSTRKLSPANLERECVSIAYSLTGREKYENDFRIVFVCEEAPQSNVDLILKTQYKLVEVMTYNNLSINPTKYFLVPKHELVPKEEESQILEKYNCLRKNLTKEFPRILSSDPIARWYGMTSGRLCKITRTSEQSGRHIVYRVVI